MRLIPYVLTTALLLTFGCGKKAPENKTNEEEPMNASEAVSTAMVDIGQGKLPKIDNLTFTEIEGGLKYVDLREGSGDPIEDGQLAVVHYTGWLVNGRTFDSSRPRDKAFEFNVGAGRVIQGWDKGVKGMSVGTERLIYIPSKYGYGATGAGGVIPPNADLIFEVELVKIQ